MSHVHFRLSHDLFHGFTIRIPTEQVCESFSSIGECVGNEFRTQLKTLFQQHGLITLQEKALEIPLFAHLHHTLTEVLDMTCRHEPIYVCIHCLQT